MAVPAFKAVGTGSTGNPAWPAHVAGDFALLCVEHQPASSTVSTPAGWVAAARVEFSGGATICSIFYRFAQSSSETAPIIAGPTDHTWSVIVTYTNVNTTSPIHGVATSWTTQDACGLPGMTTFVDECCIVQVAAYSADNPGPATSGATNIDLGSLTNRYDAGTTSGNGGGIIIYDGTLTSKGTFGITSFTDILSPPTTGFANVTLGLMSADQGFSTSPVIVNVYPSTPVTVPVPSPYAPVSPEFVDHTAMALNRLCEQFKSKAT